MKTFFRISTLLCLLACATPAQTLVQTIPQSVRLRLLTNAAAPTTVQISTNVGQNQHYITYATAGGTTADRILLRLEASHDGTTFFRISNDAIQRSDSDNPVNGLFAVGFYPVLRLNLVTITGGTVTVDYSGTSAAFGQPAGTFQRNTALRRAVAQARDVDVAFVNILPSPTGSTSGRVYVNLSTDLGVGVVRTLVIDAVGVAGQAQGTILSEIIPTAGDKFAFDVPDVAASTVNIGIIIGAGVSSNVIYDIYYEFYPSGDAPTCTLKQNINVTGSGNTEIIPIPATFGLSGFSKVHICHISFAFASAVDVKLTEGTGANCAIGTADLTGLYRGVTSLTLDFGLAPLMTTGNVRAVCINSSAIVNGGGVVIYSWY